MCPPAAVYDMDFQQMVAFHRAKNADVTIAMHPVSSLQADDWGLAAWAEVISCPVLAASQQPAKLACTVRRHADQSIQACITDVLQVPECDARSKGIAQVHTSSCEWPADGLPWRGRVQAIAIAALPRLLNLPQHVLSHHSTGWLADPAVPAAPWSSAHAQLT